jgi:hypothetical protein
MLVRTGVCGVLARSGRSFVWLVPRLVGCVIMYVACTQYDWVQAGEPSRLTRHALSDVSVELHALITGHMLSRIQLVVWRGIGYEN